MSVYVRAFLLSVMSCKTTALLAAYLEDSKDTQGVLELIRHKYPRSISTYITQIKREWLSLNKTCESYSKDYNDLVSTVRGWKAKASSGESKTLEVALTKLQEFNTMSMQQKYSLQRSLKSRNYTTHAAVDDLLQKLVILPQFIADLKIDVGERVAIQQRSAEALNDKSAASMTIEGSALLQRLSVILTSKKSNIFDVACALSCATGRRMIEVFKVGQFEPIPGQPRTCIFSGQAKKQFENAGYKIPLLFNLSVLQPALTRLRISKSTEDMSNSEVNLKFSSSCNAAARRLFGDGRTYHSCRAVYGVLSYHIAMPHSYSLNLWLSKVLGHVSMVNSLNYSSIHVEKLDEKDKHAFNFE